MNLLYQYGFAHIDECSCNYNARTNLPCIHLLALSNMNYATQEEQEEITG